MKAKELRDQSVEELEAMLEDLKKEKYKNINELRLSKKNEFPHLNLQIRKKIARILTILKEKQLNIRGNS